VAFAVGSAIRSRHRVDAANPRRDRLGMESERLEQWGVAAVCSCLRTDPVVGILTIDALLGLVGQILDRLRVCQVLEILGAMQRRSTLPAGVSGSFAITCHARVFVDLLPRALSR